jgi:putative phage-type endonuclease
MTTDRTAFIGSTDAAPILGLSPWKTALDVFLEKRGLAEREPADPQRAKVLNRGRRLEPVVLEMLADETGIQAVRRNVRYVHKTYPFLAAEIDAETADERNIEVKTASIFRLRDWGDVGTDELPTHYLCQVQHQMMVTGRSWTIVPVLFGGDELKIYEVERDEAIIHNLRQREIEFWQEHVLPGIPPLPRTAADLARQFPRDSGKTVQLPPACAEDLFNLRMGRVTIKRIEEDNAQLEFRLKALMADASVLEYEGTTVATWKTQLSKRIDLERLRRDFHEVAEQVTVMVPSRVFRVK